MTTPVGGGRRRKRLTICLLHPKPHMNLDHSFNSGFLPTHAAHSLDLIKPRRRPPISPLFCASTGGPAPPPPPRYPNPAAHLMHGDTVPWQAGSPVMLIMRVWTTVPLAERPWELKAWQDSPKPQLISVASSPYPAHYQRSGTVGGMSRLQTTSAAPVICLGTEGAALTKQSIWPVRGTSDLANISPCRHRHILVYRPALQRHIRTPRLITFHYPIQVISGH